MLSLLLAQTLSQSITVTATRTETRVADTPASVVVLSKEDLDHSAGATIDDALRGVAGFTLFRRTGSRVANPTTQGVTLRGVGASGASRALVLDDGVPLNDPFGGWVYWGRVPRAAIARAEVLRGGASDLYGSSAMGGVIQFVRRRDAGLSVDAEGGSEETGIASLFKGWQRDAWSGDFAADLLTTGGYVLVRPEDRGAVDVAADSRHASVDATVRNGGAFLRASYYDESRHNGTPLQRNETTTRQLAAGADAAVGGGTLALRAYGSDQDYFQTFSSIADDRASERLTVEQTVPSRGAGGSAQWTRGLHNRHVLVAGADMRYASGESDEVRYTPAGTFNASSGGVQRTAALYAEGLFTITPSLTLNAGLRTDWWRNRGALFTVTEGQLNPRLSLLWRMNDGLAFSASGYTAFRAPTLNELYRGFRVGNVITDPNPSLKSEELTGFELGARARNTRLTLFATDVNDAIANVTIAQNDTVIIRQRQNIGSTRSLGAELDSDWRLGAHWRAAASWLSVDARVRGGELDGRRVPQVPRHQATAQLSWSGAMTGGLELRWSSRQFDDDRNELPLRSYLVTNLFLSHPVYAGVDATLSIENLFDRDVEAGATPVITLGQPRAIRVGLRYSR